MARRTPQLDAETYARLQRIAGGVARKFRGTFDDAFQAACEAWLTTEDAPTDKRWVKCYFAALRAGAVANFGTFAEYTRWWRAANRDRIKANEKARYARDKKLRTKMVYRNGHWTEERNEPS
jgi:hypothetical protein